jgi:hypothetical protein
LFGPHLAYKYGIPFVRITDGCVYKSFSTFLLRERGNGREEFEKNCMVPIICSSEGHLWWLEPMFSFQQLVLDGNLRAEEGMPVVCVHYVDQAIPSWARWVLPDSKALCLCPTGACESPWVPVQTFLSWCSHRASSCGPVPRESRCYRKVWHDAYSSMAVARPPRAY